MKTPKEKFIKEFAEALREGNGSIFAGAGVSMAAGYPSWIGLLEEIGDELGVESRDVHDLAALAQWSIHANKGDSKIKAVINREISPVRPSPLEAQIIARLPASHIWTTNYDRVIERAFEEIGRPIQPISAPKDLAIKPVSGATRLYKMHGSVTDLSDIVISTDDYELFSSKRGAFLPILQAHLTTTSMLFVGISFSDPNIRHVLSLIRERFQTSPPSHFAIIRPPRREDFKTEPEYEARKRQHELWSDDLERYGLHVVEIKDFAEIAPLLLKLERELAKTRVWVSGSWPIGAAGSSSIVELGQQLGAALAKEGKTLVTGYGLTVGSASLAGFLDGLRDAGEWGISERLIARPFPQPDQTGADHKAQWTALRKEMANLAGVVIIVGGKKLQNGSEVIADGVLDEVEAAQATGSFIIPIGISGGAAERVARQLLTTAQLNAQGARVRPSDDDIEFLLMPDNKTSEIVRRVIRIIRQL